MEISEHMVQKTKVSQSLGKITMFFLLLFVCFVLFLLFFFVLVVNIVADLETWFLCLPLAALELTL